jgi:hypothetical protein
MGKKQVFRIDENNVLIEPVMISRKYDAEGNPLAWEVPDDCIEVKPPDGLYWPVKWDGIEWATTLTQEEINQIKANAPVQPPSNDELQTEIKKLKSQNAEILFKLVMNGIM